MPSSAIKRLPKALTGDELNALRCVPKNLRDRALIETLAGCGLRVSEACSLQVDDIHWSSDSPSVRLLSAQRPNHPPSLPPAHPRSASWIWLPESLYPVLPGHGR